MNEEQNAVDLSWIKDKTRLEYKEAKRLYSVYMEIAQKTTRDEDRLSALSTATFYAGRRNALSQVLDWLGE